MVLILNRLGYGHLEWIGWGYQRRDTDRNETPTPSSHGSCHVFGVSTLDAATVRGIQGHTKSKLIFLQ